MAVLIHALGASMGGAVRHLTNFLPELGKQDSNRDYIVLVRESIPELDLPENITLERIPDNKASGWIARVIYDGIALPKKLKQENFSAIISIANFGPIWSPVPHIFFQRNPLYYCSYYLSRIRVREKIETLLRRRLAVESMKRAELIVTPSNAMAEMIKETCPEVKNRRFYTLYHGFSKESLSEPLADKYTHMLSVEGIRLLYPTHPAPHKGFEVLFDILACLKQSKLRFKLFTTISLDDWPQGVQKYERRVRELGLNNDVIFMGRIPQRQMGELYKKCDLMVYPSLCESFGFSMIEAMAHGLPIVAARTAVNQEICKEGAYYYSPLDYVEGAEVIRKIVNLNLSKKIADQGIKRATLFDWGWQRYTFEFIKMLGEFL
jgi:glycosyltransferase involved in cell wall biosynthesis